MWRRVKVVKRTIVLSNETPFSEEQSEITINIFEARYYFQNCTILQYHLPTCGLLLLTFIFVCATKTERDKSVKSEPHKKPEMTPVNSKSG